MSEVKHTQHGWTVTDTCSDYVFCVVRRGNGKQDINVGNEEDAHLIAAAPELLAALKAMLGAQPPFRTVWLSEEADAIQMAEEVIAKAEGKV